MSIIQTIVSRYFMLLSHYFTDHGNCGKKPITKFVEQLGEHHGDSDTKNSQNGILWNLEKVKQ